MSTEIRDISNLLDVHRLTHMGGGVHMTVHHADSDTIGVACALMRRADFLAAVETECGVRIVPADAIVIERINIGISDRVEAQSILNSAGVKPADASYFALTIIAAAEYLDAHPPVPPVSDEDVETLGHAIESVARLGDRFVGSDQPDSALARDIARRLLATGRVSVTHE